MTKDKNGKELQIGDEVMVRGRVASITTGTSEADGEFTILEVDWDEPKVPVINYVYPHTVEKVD